jgi:hypothetical protein
VRSGQYYTGRWTLDERLLMDAVNRRRELADLTWSDVAAETGLSPPTFSRLNGGRGLSVHTLATLMAWLNEPLPFTARTNDDMDTE